MDDPQREFKEWLAEKLAAHGVATKVAAATGISNDKLTRSKELSATDPKKRRQVPLEEIKLLAVFFGELPPGFEGMTAWLTPGKRPSVVSSFDPDDEDQEHEEGSNGYAREHWVASIKGAMPEIDVKLGAGHGQVGDVINLPVGGDGISGHRVVAEWLLSEAFLRHEAKASLNQTVIMEVVGDSMQPAYLPGDRVMVDLSQNRMVVDTVYAISDGTSEPQIKRLQRIPFSEPVQVRIISDNTAFQTDVVDLDRLTIIGRVCGHIARK